MCYRNQIQKGRFNIKTSDADLANLVKLHEDVGYVAEFISQPHLNGGVLKLPENVYLNLPATSYIYEMEEGKLTIYTNRKKYQSIECPSYGLPSLVIIDIFVQLFNRDISLLLLKVKKNDTEIKLQSFKKDEVYNIVHSVLSNPNPAFTHLENKMSELMRAFLNNTHPKVDDSIYTAFQIVATHFNQHFLKD